MMLVLYSGFVEKVINDEHVQLLVPTILCYDVGVAKAKIKWLPRINYGKINKNSVSSSITVYCYESKSIHNFYITP